MIDTKDYIAKKYNLKIKRHHEIDIPNMGRDQLAELFFELGFTKGAEIGVEKGLYSEVLLKANKKLHLYCIDPWTTLEYDPAFKEVYGEEKLFNSYYKEAIARLSKYDRCTIIKKSSMEALPQFEDNSLDFVYIDANHDFLNVTRDVCGWSKKVKVGGIVAGHDYAYFKSSKFNHVKRVISAYTKAYGLFPLFVVGAKEMDDPNMIRDRFRSWFFIKK